MKTSSTKKINTIQIPASSNKKLKSSNPWDKPQVSKTISVLTPEV
jgi:hypothetical protein